jgi:hypothetical protein
VCVCVRTHTQVSSLRDVRGGDDARISVLESEMGVKLLGRPTPGPELEGMVLAVARVSESERVGAMPRLARCVRAC